MKMGMSLVTLVLVAVYSSVGQSNPSSSQGVQTQMPVSPFQGTYVSSYSYSISDHSTGALAPGQTSLSANWQLGLGGSCTYASSWFSRGNYSGFSDTQFLPVPWPGQIENANNIGGGTGLTTTYLYNVPFFYFSSFFLGFRPLIANNTSCFNYDNDQAYIDNWTEQETTKLATGGAKNSTLQNLWLVSVQAQNIDVLDWYLDPQEDYANPSVAMQKITVAGQHPDQNGNVYLILPDNKFPDITPRYNGTCCYSYTVTATKYHNYLELFCEQATPGGIFPYGPNDVGHVFWRLSTEVPTNVIAGAPSGSLPFLSHCWGFYPTNDTVTALFSLPGKLNNDDGNLGLADIARKFYIGWPNLLKGLTFTTGIESNPPVYTLLVYDCVDAAVSAAAASGLKIGTQQFEVAEFNGAPQFFAYYLARLYPGPWLGNTNIFYP
jgi:hypothetical protein